MGDVRPAWPPSLARGWHLQPRALTPHASLEKLVSEYYPVNLGAFARLIVLCSGMRIKRHPYAHAPCTVLADMYYSSYIQRLETEGSVRVGEA